MRIGPERWAAVCVPLMLLAVAACGSEEPEAQSPPEVGTASSTDGRSSDSGGSGPREDSGGESRGGSGARGSDSIGDSAGPGSPGASGAQGGPRGENVSVWPEDDVVGLVARPGASGTKPRDTAIVTYEAGETTDFADAIRTASASWNDRVSNVRLRPVPDGEEPDIRIEVVKGWPGADPAGPSLGRGTISIGLKALTQGHDPVRVVAHEFGHMLGLDDKQPGPCSSVMSGKSPGTSCKNFFPDRTERRQVERNFAETGT
ncbi:MAG TPA: snapalysin family zinc-dependent metalloprotease [Streptomyces sp.]|nr:snapalysin family zinc-dependent metalloprotease [Streptomyces sp.]